MSDFELGKDYYFTLRTTYIDTELGGGFVFKDAGFYDGFHAWLKTTYNATPGYGGIQFETEQELMVFLLKWK